MWKYSATVLRINTLHSLTQYQCFLETCSEKFNNAEERRIHCVEKHNFPTDFRFDLSWRKLKKNKKKVVSKKKDNLNILAMEFDTSDTVNKDESSTLEST